MLTLLSSIGKYAVIFLHSFKLISLTLSKSVKSYISIDVFYEVEFPIKFAVLEGKVTEIKIISLFSLKQLNKSTYINSSL